MFHLHKAVESKSKGPSAACMTQTRMCRCSREVKIKRGRKKIKSPRNRLGRPQQTVSVLPGSFPLRLASLSRFSRSFSSFSWAFFISFSFFLIVARSVWLETPSTWTKKKKRTKFRSCDSFLQNVQMWLKIVAVSPNIRNIQVKRLALPEQISRKTFQGKITVTPTGSLLIHETAQN